jgi:hypothetical protein
MPPTTEPQINNIWASTTPAAAAGTVEFLTLPSGQTCRVRRIGIEGMIEAGLLTEGDSLMAIVDEKHVKRARNNEGKNPKVKDLSDRASAVEIMRNPEMLKKVVFFVDQTLPVVVVEPSIRAHFKILSPAKNQGDLPETAMIPIEERDAGFVYTDQVGLEDKMFIFQYCVGGTRDIETFRTQSADAVAGVDDGEGVRGPSERPSRNRDKRSGRR